MENNDKIEVLINKILNKIKLNLEEKHKKLLIQIVKFFIVGVIATLIDFVFLFIFKSILNLNIVLANTLSFIISLIYNYIASTKWVFDVSENNDKKKSFILFIFFSVLGLMLNDLIVWGLSEKIGIHYMLAKIFATAVVMVFNFITRKMFLEEKSTSN